jgi:2-polyprenyl-3-methyl-5-hydroxy-6-metoxy-1,4-benzoquinol methylase
MSIGSAGPQSDAAAAGSGSGSATQRTGSTAGIVTGNHTPKYTAKNPAIRWLTNRWLARLDATIDHITASSRPTRPLEVGAGEGVISARLHERFGSCVGLDLPDDILREEWRTRPGPHYLNGDAQQLPFADDSFDLIVCVEVLEHLVDPAQGLREIARVGTKHLLLSVPREPIFRGCNLFTGRYVKDLGNTPGHFNHWSTRSFKRFVSEVAEVREVRTPFPWTVIWATLPD